MDVAVKFGDSRPKRSRDIRLPHFVTDVERTTAPPDGLCGNRAKPLMACCPKTSQLRLNV